MHTTPLDRLVGPYTIRDTGEPSSSPVIGDSLADIIDGPHLKTLLVDRFGLGADAAEQAAISTGATLHQAWRATAYGENYTAWVGRLPEVLLKCLVEMAARAETDPHATAHELRMARLMLTELAIDLGSR
ncbi:hypothetical protein [Streptomyces sp. NBC_01022]|uniref:hypothetical protein n=1 Tax=Streptomyces sp. NBC_01022 TaxID=2903723 RepID=UPI002DD9D75E|nr:hypothetical protein [Streptomyces sp. NBC_01022]WRZ82614.1 hypothetical protein OG316_21315 [Streptomyces sp. NBC_01022]